MRHTKYYCDHCGKELNYNTDKYINTLLQYPDNKITLDLCEDCFEILDDNIEDLLNNFIKDEDEDDE